MITVYQIKNVTGKEVQKRNCSMVYQQFINYPNFTVYENIASPLKITGVKPDEIKERVGKVAELLKLYLTIFYLINCDHLFYNI